MTERPLEYYLALVSAMIFVVMQHKEKPWLARVGIAGASGGIAVGVAADLAAAISWMGETTAVTAVAALAYALLDLCMAILADRQTVIDTARKLMGKS